MFKIRVKYVGIKRWRTLNHFMVTKGQVEFGTKEICKISYEHSFSSNDRYTAVKLTWCVQSSTRWLITLILQLYLLIIRAKEKFSDYLINLNKCLKTFFARILSAYFLASYIINWDGDGEETRTLKTGDINLCFGPLVNSKTFLCTFVIFVRCVLIFK